MSIIGIVCEFNPFHSGHKHLIDCVKKDNDVVIAVMSGNFVQRGEPAIFPKALRAKVALENGVDIVLELPFLYATASAEIFASNAVRILNAFGCDKIAFGAENSNLEQLNKVVDILCSNDFDEKIKSHLAKGVSYPTARQKAFDSYNVNFDISSPNNILAIEYLKAIKRQNAHLEPLVVERVGAGYNENCAIDNIASATHIRNLIYNNEYFENYIPSNSAEIYNESIANGNIVSLEKYNLSALTLLRSKMNNELSSIANMAEGIENRIVSEIKANSNLNEIFDNIKTKRFTHSRIRRAVLSVMFDIDKKYLEIEAPYCRLLGFNKKKSVQMGELAKNSKLPFVASYSDIQGLDDINASKVFEIEDITTDFYNLILEKSCNCGTERKHTPIKFWVLQVFLQNSCFLTLKNVYLCCVNIYYSEKCKNEKFYFVKNRFEQ